MTTPSLPIDISPPDRQAAMLRGIPTIPTDVRELLVKLGFIAEIHEGDKPNVLDMTVVQKSSWRGAFYRWLRGENRTNMIMHLESTIEQSKSVVENYASSPHVIELVQSYLKRARHGIVNLERTYADAPSIKVRLHVLHSAINLQILTLESFRTPLSRSLEERIRITDDVSASSSLGSSSSSNHNQHITAACMGFDPIDVDDEDHHMAGDV